MTGVGSPVVYPCGVNLGGLLAEPCPRRSGPIYGAEQNVPCGDGHALLPSETDKSLVEMLLIVGLVYFVISFDGTRDR